MGNWALINSGTIQKIISADSFNARKASTSLGYDTEPQNVDWYAVNAGDTFDGFNFYRNGVKIEKILTPDEKVTIVAIEQTNQEIESIMSGQLATDLELRIIALEERA